LKALGFEAARAADGGCAKNAAGAQAPLVFRHDHLMPASSSSRGEGPLGPQPARGASARSRRRRL